MVQIWFPGPSVKNVSVIFLKSQQGNLDQTFGSVRVCWLWDFHEISKILKI